MSPKAGKPSPVDAANRWKRSHDEIARPTDGFDPNTADHWKRSDDEFARRIEATDLNGVLKTGLGG